jgi:acyl-CoA thioesterase
MSADGTLTLADALGLEKVVAAGEDGRAIVHYRARPEMCHSGGVVQGGFVTGWIDAAMANAVFGRTKGEFSPLSLEIKVSFLQSAAPGLIVAEAWIERMGAKTVFLEGLIRNEAGDVLAKGSSTAKLVPVKRE